MTVRKERDAAVELGTTYPDLDCGWVKSGQGRLPLRLNGVTELRKQRGIVRTQS